VIIVDVVEQDYVVGQVRDDRFRQPFGVEKIRGFESKAD